MVGIVKGLYLQKEKKTFFQHATSSFFLCEMRVSVRKSFNKVFTKRFPCFIQHPYWQPSLLVASTA